MLCSTSQNPLLRFFFNLPLQVRFLIIGGTNTGISYVLFIIFLFMLGNDAYQVALALAWILSSFISFTTQKIFVFQTKGAWLQEYVRCLVSWFIAYGINAVTLEIFAHYLGVAPYLAQLVALCLTTVLTYILFKKFAFKKENTHEE